jgi:hypothetical protein
MLVRVLTKLKNDAESRKFTKPYNWAAISKMMQNVTGQALDYDSFKQQVDSNPNLENLFHSFDEQGVTFVKPIEVKTPQAANKEASKAAVNSSAKKAAANLLKK